MSDVLEARALTSRRGDARLFTDLSFEIATGTALAVRGANGCGKTTLLRCVAGLTRADGGEVRWRGRRVDSHDAGWRGDIAWSGHLPAIQDDLSAEENLRFALRLRAAAVPGHEVALALERAGLGIRKRLPARRLSAGQRRRIGLARLSLDRACIWLLDEPLTALDDEGQGYFLSLLSKHLDGGGLALIATHHSLAIAPSRLRELLLGGAGNAPTANRVSQ